MILCGVIARGTTILAKYIQVAGSNMNEFINNVLEKISATCDTSNNSYTHGEFMIYYISERNIIYLAIAQQDIPQEKAFEFLEGVKEKFQRYAGDRAMSALENDFDGEFGEVLKNGMLRATSMQISCAPWKDLDEDIKGIMIQNIEDAISRGGEISCTPFSQTDDLQTNAGTFKRQAVVIIQRRMWYVFELEFS